MTETSKRKAGRPPIGQRALRSAVPIRLPDAMRAEIEGIQSGRLDQPDLSSVIRELIAEALEARRKKK